MFHLFSPGLFKAISVLLFNSHKYSHGNVSPGPLCSSQIPNPLPWSPTFLSEDVALKKLL